MRQLSGHLARAGCEVGLAYYASAEEMHTDLAFEQKFLSSLNDAGVESIHLGVPATGRRNPFAAARHLWRAVTKFKPDVLHLHMPGDVFARLLMPSRVSTVYTHHASMLRVGPKLFWLFDMAVDRYVAICKLVEDSLRLETSKPVELIMNAVELVMDNGAKSRPKTHKTIFLSVGGLRPAKDYGTLLLAARIVQDKTKTPVEFNIAGDGSERESLERMIEELGLQGTVNLLGTRSDVSRLMLEADALLMTSIWEGLPMTLLEAVHSGLPIIATDVGGCPEVVENGVNGFLTPAGNAEETAVRILRLVNEPALRKKMALASKARSKEFDIRTNSRRHLELYERLLEAKH